MHSTRLERLGRSTEHHGAELAEREIQAVNFHHQDWTGGHIALYHRFDRLTFAWDLQFERVLDEILDAGIDGVFSDHVDLMVAAVDAIA